MASEDSGRSARVRGISRYTFSAGTSCVPGSLRTSAAGQLPKQFIALCHVHLSACWGQTGSLRRSLRMARHFGVSKDHAVQIMALAMLYLGDVAMDSALTDANEILAEWPEAGPQA